MRRKYLLLLFSLTVLVFYIIWEYRVALWADTQAGAIIRVDLLFIYPLLTLLFILTGMAWWNDRNK